MTPIADRLMPIDSDPTQDPLWPLKLVSCCDCGLVQIGNQPPPDELFGANYPYLSSISSSWRQHAQDVARDLMARLGKRDTPFILEIASNDGGQLLPFLNSGCSVLGVEPSGPPAAAASACGVPTREIFFNVEVAEQLASEVGHADVILLHNVLAHVPDPQDLLLGAALLLCADGIVSIEIGYFGAMVEQGHFDTIYHQHKCYFSLASLEHLATRCGFRIIDAQRTALQGGSLSVILAKQGSESGNVTALRDWEADRQLISLRSHLDYATYVHRKRNEIRQFLTHYLEPGRQLAAYGAAAKGTTLIAACDLANDDIAFVIDNNPIKQGMRMPGLALPIVSPDLLNDQHIDGLLLFAWNLAEELSTELAWFKNRGGAIIAPLPEPRFVT
jgi:SAM-dependent methyltransferase